MARQYQIAGRGFVNETSTRQYQIAGCGYILETIAAAIAAAYKSHQLRQAVKRASFY